MSKVAERVREAVDVEELLRHYNASRIRRTGVHVRSCCPLHAGDNPSAFVFDDDKKLWYCHTGCSEGGDVFDFVQKMDGVNFRQAAELLAEMFEVEVDWDNETIEENPFKDEAKDFIAMTKRRAKGELPLYELDAETVKVKSFRTYSPEAIDFWGLRVAKTGVLANRLILPLEDTNKRTVGYSGRRIKAHMNAKWKHEPSGLEMGRIVPGLGRNRESIIELGEVIICEGLFDCMNLWQHGLQHTGATMAANLTDEQVREIQKVAFTIVLGYDNDLAGRNATRKALEKLEPIADIRILNLPEGKDPGDLNHEEILEAYATRLRPREWRQKYGHNHERRMAK